MLSRLMRRLRSGGAIATIAWGWLEVVCEYCKRGNERRQRGGQIAVV